MVMRCSAILAMDCFPFGISHLITSHLLGFLHDGVLDLVYVRKFEVKVIDAGLYIASHHGLIATFNKHLDATWNPKYQVIKTRQT